MNARALTRALGRLLLLFVTGSVLLWGLVSPSLASSSPTIIGFAPSVGVAGSMVTINGSGLAGATSVQINGYHVSSFTVRSNARITAVVPSKATSGWIRVVTPSGVATSRDRLKVMSSPNIVLILTDDQRWDEISRMPIVQSQLVDKGVTFSNGFVSNSLCCPSRASILTGKYSHGTDIYANHPPNGGFGTFVRQRHEDDSTIATWLQARGYRTALIGKYLNGYTPTRARRVSPGWDVWDALALPRANKGKGGYYNYTVSENGERVKFGSAPSDYSTDVFSGMASDFITGTPADQPLFLYFAPRAPHAPSTPAVRDQDACPGLPPLRPRSYNEKNVSDKPQWVRNLPRISLKKQKTTGGVHLRHCQSLLAVDDAVGNILTALQRTGRLPNTLIVFTSDNGLSLGEHRWANLKKAAYEEDIRIPIVVRYDPLTNQTAQTDGHFVLNIDFAPTFAAVAGASALGADGMSFLPLLSGGGTSWRTDFLVEHWEAFGTDRKYIPPYCGVRAQGFIYVKYNTGEEELYDLSADPLELKNQAGNPAYSTERAQLHARMIELCSPPPPDFTP